MQLSSILSLYRDMSLEMIFTSMENNLELDSDIKTSKLFFTGINEKS